MLLSSSAGSKGWPASTWLQELAFDALLDGAGNLEPSSDDLQERAAGLQAQLRAGSHLRWLSWRLDLLLSIQQVAGWLRCHPETDLCLLDLSSMRLLEFRLSQINMLGMHKNFPPRGGIYDAIDRIYFGDALDLLRPSARCTGGRKIRPRP